MKVILLQDVPKVGKRYEIKEVNSGFARNFLLPQKKALFATPEKISFYEKSKKEEDEKRIVQETLLEKNLEKLGKLALTFKSKASESGSLYAQITKEDIAKSLLDETHIEISPEYIHLEKPIKEIGDHKILLLVGNKKGTVALRVEKDS